MDSEKTDAAGFYFVVTEPFGGHEIGTHLLASDVGDEHRRHVVRVNGSAPDMSNPAAAPQES